MQSAAEQYYHRGNALQNAGDFAGALAAYDVAVQASPHIAALHYSRGNALVMLDRLDEGIGAYDRCLMLEPANPQAQYNRCTALIRLQRWQDALDGLDALVRLHPRMADAWNNRSGVLQALGRFEEAVAELEKAASGNEPGGVILDHLGDALAKAGRAADARATWQKSLEAFRKEADEKNALLVETKLKTNDDQ